MCGIIGVIGHNKERTRIFTEMLYADVFRGYDSTGVFGVDEREKGSLVRIEKRALPAYEFLHTVMWKRFVDKIQSQDYLVGHNRKTTLGTTDDYTAHPFRCEHITLVHNGTLRGNWRTYLKAPTGTSVDSYAIANAIATMGADAVIPMLEGAFTLVWFDQKENTFNIIRNDERPLGMLKIKDSAVVFASEIDMAKWIVTRNGGKIESVWEPAEGVQHIYTKAGKEVATKKHKLFTAPVTYGTSGTAGNRSYSQTYNNGYEGYSGNYTSNKLKGLGLTIGDTLYFKVDKMLAVGLNTDDKFTVHGTTVGLKVPRTLKAYWTSGKVFADHTANAIYRATITGMETVYDQDVLVRDVMFFAENRRDFRKKLKAINSTFQDEGEAEEGAATPTENVIALPPPRNLKDATFQGPGQRNYPLDRLAPYLVNGCGCCDEPVTKEDVIAGEVSWLGDSPVCKKCQAEFDITEGVIMQ